MRYGELDPEPVCDVHGTVYGRLPSVETRRVRACPTPYTAYEVCYESTSDHSYLGSYVCCNIFDAAMHAEQRRSEYGHTFAAFMYYRPTGELVGVLAASEDHMTMRRRT